MNKAKLILIIFIQLTLGFSTTLQSVFDAAQPGNGYDKYLILSRSEVYTGGLGIFEGDVLIEGNGAIIDLQEGSGIWVYADENYPASLHLRYCSIVKGGYYGVSYGGTSTGTILNCNFVQNDFGVKLYDESVVDIKNCNFIENTTYGLGIYSESPTCNVSYTNAWGNGEAAWSENCPG